MGTYVIKISQGFPLHFYLLQVSKILEGLGMRLDMESVVLYPDKLSHTHAQSEAKHLILPTAIT